MANGVAGAWSRAQAEVWDHVTGKHEARRFRLLLRVCPGRAGAAAVFRLPHATRVFWAPTATPFTQLHHAGDNLLPPLLDVLTLLHNEGCEPAPAAHQWLLPPAPDVGPLKVHRACLLRQVGALER
jgi:hypothetical protein